MLRVFLLAIGSLLGSACLEDLVGKSCTEIGCSDGVQISVRAPDNSWPTGQYAIDFTVDGKTHVCTIRIPDELPSGTNIEQVACNPSFEASFTPETICTEQRTADAVTQTCVPVPDHWILQASVLGTPQSVHTEVRRDGETILEQTTELRYRETRPNGPGCEPLCRRAELELTLR